MNTTSILHFIHPRILTFIVPKNSLYLNFCISFISYLLKLSQQLYFVKNLTKFYYKVVLSETLATRRNVEKRQK